MKFVSKRVPEEVMEITLQATKAEFRILRDMAKINVSVPALVYDKPGDTFQREALTRAMGDFSTALSEAGVDK